MNCKEFIYKVKFLNALYFKQSLFIKKINIINISCIGLNQKMGMEETDDSQNTASTHCPKLEPIVSLSPKVNVM